MTLEIVGFLLVLTHVATVALLVLWFGLKKPTTFAEFWRRFKREFLSISPGSRR